MPLGHNTYMRHWWVTILLGLVVGALLVPIAMRIGVHQRLYTSVDAVPASDVVIVLGASVVRGKPSPVLKERADTAIALYKAGKAPKILVTGDNGALSHDEVTPVRKYLLDAGVPAQDIFLDHAGFDTYSSIYRAREVFKAEAVTIVTQDFHLPRAVWIARQLDVAASGVVAEGSGGSLADYIREIPASIKAVIDVVMQREPKYLGPPIPLSGDGQATWF